MNPLIGNGVSKQIVEIDSFINKCTVINNTLAWDIGVNFDPYKCIDIDPIQIYETCKDVENPLIWVM